MTTPDSMPRCVMCNRGYSPDTLEGMCGFCGTAYRAGQAAALAAARDAVDALHKEGVGPCHVVHVCDAVRAIDALREGK